MGSGFHQWFQVCLLAILSGCFSSAVFADTPGCLVSFDSARLNVCDDRISLANEDLGHLADQKAFADSNIRIVKFDAPITAGQRVALTALGVEILGYVPFYAYKVRMDAGLDRRVRDIPGVNWTGPYLPVWKVEINLANALRHGRIMDQAGHHDRLWVALHPNISGARTRAALESIPGVSFDVGGRNFDHDFMVLGFERAQLGGIVHQLAMNEAVNAIGFHWHNELENSQAGWLHQSGESDPEHLPVFNQGIFGCGQIASVLDSGLHQPNCAFEDPDFGNPLSEICNQGSGCPATMPDFGHRKIGLHYKWSGTAGGPGDEHGHGTHVSASIVGNNHAKPVDCQDFTTLGGLSDLDGTAPGARLIMQEAGADLQYMNSLGGTLYHAASTARANGAHLHNNSWGSSCRDQSGACIAGCQVGYRPHTRGGDAVVWENPELMVFVAAGNSGAGCGPGADVGAPGNAKNVFSIGASQRGTEANNMADFSSRGPASDRRTKPDLTAQGQNILSANRNACGTLPASGTSMASPTAAGLALLVREYLQRGFHPFGFEEPSAVIPDPSAALIKAIMVNGAVAMDGNGTSGNYPDINQGWGRILLDSALYFDGDDRRLWLHDGITGLKTGDVDEHIVVVDEGQPLAITLVWHDFPAEENAQPHIVNILRLEVQTPDGEVWTQKLSPGGGLTDPNPFQDTTGTDHDDRNTVHQIVLDAPVAGAYPVRVEAIQVAMGDAQPYALVATGNILGVGDPDFVLRASPTAVAVCQGVDAEFEISVFGLLDFDDEVTLSVTGLPSGAGAAFSVNPVLPADPAISVLTVGGTAAVMPGAYDLVFSGQSSGPGFDPTTHALDLGLRVDAVLSAPAPLAPADGVIDVVLRPGFAWDGVDDALEYRIQVATDAGFNDLVIDEMSADTSFTPAAQLDIGSEYFWRVRAVNACAENDWSATFAFTTQLEPIADITPVRFSFELPQGGIGTDTLLLTNAGTGNLLWNIQTDAIESAPGLAGHDAALDEAFTLGDFHLDSPANGGSPVGFQVDAGLATRGDVTGFSFAGTVTGINGSISWASDLCMIVTSPDGATHALGGFSGTQPGCTDNPWNFDGSVSSNDGSYQSTHGDVFDPVEEDNGEWTFTFVNDLDHTGAATMQWSDVIVTLHKQALPVCLEQPTGVPWLSVSPGSGGTPQGQTDELTVTVSVAGTAVGHHEGYLCLTTNDANRLLFPVAVELTVTDEGDWPPDEVFEDRFESPLPH